MSTSNPQNRRAGRRGEGDYSGHAYNESRGTHYFLGVGISQYKKLSFLPNAAKDVSDFKDVLESHYGFDEPNRVKMLLNEEATKKAIKANVDEWKNIINEQDSLLIYFAGHGDYKEKIGFWCLVDYERNDENTFLEERKLTEWLAGFKCATIFVIEDRCHGGTAQQVSQQWPDILSASETARWMSVLSSTHEREKASDGPSGQNSPFAKELIHVLTKNKRDSIAAHEIHHQIKKIPSSPKLSSLLQGASGKPYTFFRERKHPKLCFEEQILNNYYYNQGVLPGNVLNEIINAFPNTDMRKEIATEFEKSKSKIDDELNDIISEAVKMFSDLIVKCQSYDDSLVKDAYDIIAWLQNNYPSAKRYSSIIQTRERKLDKSNKSKCIYETKIIQLPDNSKLDVGIYPVTIGMYQQFALDVLWMDYKDNEELKTILSKDDMDDDHPAINVAWEEAIRFANWLSVMNGLKPYYRMVGFHLVGLEENTNGFRLPTEEEWKNIALSGGYEDSSRLEYFERTAVDRRTGGIQKVGSKEADNNGIFDFFGNINEWCWDFDDSSSNDEVENNEAYMICKGGTYESSQERLSIDAKRAYSGRVRDVGFRLVKSVL